MFPSYGGNIWPETCFFFFSPYYLNSQVSRAAAAATASTRVETLAAPKRPCRGYLPPREPEWRPRTSGLLPRQPGECSPVWMLLFFNGFISLVSLLWFRPVFTRLTRVFVAVGTPMWFHFGFLYSTGAAKARLAMLSWDQRSSWFFIL